MKTLDELVAKIDCVIESQGKLLETLITNAEAADRHYLALDAKLRATGDGLADEMRKLTECIASLPYRKIPNAYRRKSKPLCGRCGKAFRACKCRVFQARKP